MQTGKKPFQSALYHSRVAMSLTRNSHLQTLKQTDMFLQYIWQCITLLTQICIKSEFLVERKFLPPVSYVQNML